jgi:hypothetical protein
MFKTKGSFPRQKEISIESESRQKPVKFEVNNGDNER